MSGLASAWQFLGIRGAVAVALAIALALVMWRADSLSDSLQNARDDLAAEKVRHEVTAASLVALTGELEAFVEAGKLREENRDDAIAAVAKETKELREQAEAFDIRTVEGV